MRNLDRLEELIVVFNRNVINLYFTANKLLCIRVTVIKYSFF